MTTFNGISASSEESGPRPSESGTAASQPWVSTWGTVIISTRAGWRVKRPALRTWDERRWRTFTLAAIGIGAALRALWILVLHHPFATQYIYSDMNGYVTRAKALAAGHISHYAA